MEGEEEPDVSTANADPAGHLQHIYTIAALFVLTQGRGRILLVFAPVTCEEVLMMKLRIVIVIAGEKGYNKC
ncbi:MAG: hypothetical protein EOM40_07065 [Clostridia bacterium]|nr:hypothetical protein [Clostridia bacterium]